MCLPVHECFVKLLNEWTHFGNVILPRDNMLSLAEDAIKAAEASNGGKPSFAEMWKYGGEAFAPVQSEYEKMLLIVPEPHVSQWKEKVGIDDASLSTIPPPSEQKTEEKKQDDKANGDSKVSEGDGSQGPEPMEVDK